MKTVAVNSVQPVKCKEESTLRTLAKVKQKVTFKLEQLSDLCVAKLQFFA